MGLSLGIGISLGILGGDIQLGIGLKVGEVANERGSDFSEKQAMVFTWASG
jgi:hypothetical protein